MGEKIIKGKDWTCYKVDGMNHREDGPALIYADGRQVWYYHGQEHNPNGPAVINPDGTVEYWLHGKQYTPLTDAARTFIGGVEVVPVPAPEPDSWAGSY